MGYIWHSAYTMPWDIKIIHDSRSLGATGKFPQQEKVSNWKIPTARVCYAALWTQLARLLLHGSTMSVVSALRLTIKVSLWTNYLCQCRVCSPFVEQCQMGLRSFRKAPCFECNNFESANGILRRYQAIGRWRGCWWTQSVSQFYPTLFYSGRRCHGHSWQSGVESNQEECWGWII